MVSFAIVLLINIPGILYKIYKEYYLCNIRMKKASIILLISIYTLSTFGISLKEFYCCGKLKSVTITLQEYKNQKCGKDDDKSGCCKIKFKFYKVRDNHFATDILNSSVKHFSYLSSFTPYIPISPFVKQAEIANSNHAPPLYNGVLAYISNCVFLI